MDGIPWLPPPLYEIMVDPISMIKTLRYSMVVILTPIVLVVVGIPGVWVIATMKP